MIALRVPTPPRVPFGTLTLLDRNGAAATAYTDATGTTPLATPITADATGTFPAVFVLPALWGFLRRPLLDWPTDRQENDGGMESWFGFLETVGGAYQCLINGALVFWVVAKRLTSPLTVMGAATPTGNQTYEVGVSSTKPSAAP